MSINQVSYLTTQQCFSQLATFILCTKLLIIICSLALYSVTSQKHLIESGIRFFLFKLRQNGIKEKLLEWLNSYLSQRKQKVGL